MTKIQDITNKHAPLRNLTRKEMKLKTKPWLTKGLLKSISIKNKLFKKCFKQKKVNLVSKHKLYLNKLTKLKQIAKKNYYTNELNQHKNEIGKQWKIINKIICHKRHQTEIIASILIQTTAVLQKRKP